MKTRNYISAVLLLVLGSMVFTSCVKRDDHYDPPPPTGYQYVFNEEFDHDDLGWGFDFPFDSAYGEVINGLYNFVDYSYNGGNHTAVVPTGADVDHDFLVQTRFKSDNAMALIFGASSTHYGYSFFVDNISHEFALYNEGAPGGNLQTIISWQSSSAITNGYNDVEIEQVGNVWYGYINNVKVFDITAHYLSGDQFGFMVLAGTDGKAEYLTVKW